VKRIILTGASGFIGANLTHRLLQDGHEVHLFMRDGYLRWRIEEIIKDVHIHKINLTDKQSIEKIVRNIRPEWIFHLAANGSYSWQNDLDQMVETNIIGTINLIEACLKVGFTTFVNTGSSSEYGFKDYPPAEFDWLDPNSYYAVTKASATLFCRYTAKLYKVHIPTLRLYSVYGPFENPGRLMPVLILKGLTGHLPPLVNPDIARDFVYVDDVIEAYYLAAMKPDQEFGAVYNVGTGNQTTLDKVIEIVRRVLNIPEEPQWGSMKDRRWDTSTWVANNQQIRTKLGWQPRYAFEQGFRKLVDWFCNNPLLLDHYRKQMNG